MKTVALLLLLAGLTTSIAAGQHEHVHSPYAGATQSEGTILTADEIGQLRNGEGMGLARAAELNHWPGPKHVLDLATEMGLETSREARIREIFEAMHAAAVSKGEEIISVERHLATAFASGEVDAERVGRMTGHLASLRGELQAIHLTAHLETRSVLTDEQVSLYDRLRGYGPPDGGD